VYGRIDIVGEKMVKIEDKQRKRAKTNPDVP